jgi:hypothetical protein
MNTSLIPIGARPNREHGPVLGLEANERRDRAEPQYAQQRGPFE